jgi:hypothetical protein
LGESNATAVLTNGIENSDWTASTDKLKAIAIQKWIALTNFSGMEAWTEYRRTNLPNIPQALTVTDANRPLRQFNPSTESGSNSIAVTGNRYNQNIWDRLNESVKIQ